MRFKFIVDVGENTITIQIFDSSEAVEGALENGETFATIDIDEGIKGRICKKSAEGETEIQAVIFDKEKFTEEQAKAWVDENIKKKSEGEGEGENKTEASAKIKRALFVALHRSKIHSGPFNAQDATPGQPINPDEPKASEGMIDFEIKVQDALYQMGGGMYDFIVQELFADAVIVIDFMTGKYYKLSIRVNADDTITLGQPEEYDITYTPADATPEPASEPAPEPQPNEKKSAVAGAKLIVGKAIIKANAKSPGHILGVYEMLIMDSGYTCDGRISESDQVVIEAVENKLLDGIPCYYTHVRDPETGEPVRVMCGFIKPGSTRWERNKVAGVDVWAQVAIFNNSDGRDIEPVIIASLENQTPLLGNSVNGYGESYMGERDGHQVEIFTKYESFNSVDFVDGPAWTRAGVKRKIAAAKTNQEGELTMTEKEELLELRKKTKELEGKVESHNIEKDVELLLGKSSLPNDAKDAVRPLMLSQHHPNLRKALLTSFETSYWGKAKRPLTTQTGTDGGAIDGEIEIRPLPADIQTMIERVAANCGIKPEILAAARKKVGRQLTAA